MSSTISPTNPTRTAAPETRSTSRARTSSTGSTDSSSVAHPLPAPRSSPPSRSRALSTSSITVDIDGGKRAYATEIVRALFGTSGSVGDVVDDFPCSFGMQSGRLYVSTTGVFFYSNLFGFERKIRIDYVGVEEVARLRTTSLSVSTALGEEYVFRSFEDRELVLDVVRGCSSGGGKAGGDAVPGDAPPSERVTPIARGDSTEEVVKCDSAGRGDSPSSDLGDELTPGDSRQIDRKERSVDPRERTDAGGISAVAGPAEDGPGGEEADAARWEEARRRAEGWESAVAGVALPRLSVGAFFDAFLGDDAAHPLEQFQRVCVGDNQISVEPWESGGGNGGAGAAASLSRTMRFRHKSGAGVTRRQAYWRRHGGGAASLENATKITGRGVPDAFFVEDVWFVEGDGNGGVVLDIKFRVVFTKGTMLRSIIESRSTTETKGWYGSYVSFLLRKTERGGTAGEEDAGRAAAAVEANAHAQPVPRSFHWDLLIFIKDEAGSAFRDRFGILASSVRKFASGLSATPFARQRIGQAADATNEAGRVLWDRFRILASSIHLYLPVRDAIKAGRVLRVWFGILASSIREYVPEQTREDVASAAAAASRTVGALAASARRLAPDRSKFPPYAPLAFLVVVSAVAVHRLLSRVAALEGLASDLERRLSELEGSRSCHAGPFAAGP